MRKALLRRPSAGLVVSIIALVMAMSGVSYAASKDNKKDKKIANAAAKAYFNSHIGSASVANATAATNASQLGGVPASGYTKNDCASTTGQIKGWALVSAGGSFPSALTSTGVFGYNCSGGAVQARRISTGEYEVKFLNNPAVIAVGTGDAPTTSFNFDTVAFGRFGGGDFQAAVVHITTGSVIDDPFDVVVP